jgi:hypothetical protein
LHKTPPWGNPIVRFAEYEVRHSGTLLRSSEAKAGERQNSKSEARNPKQNQMSQIQNSKRARLQAVRFGDLKIRILNLHRISNG